MGRGKLIVFEGLDRAGKSTQCERLVQDLQNDGHKVRHMRFPGMLIFLSLESRDPMTGHGWRGKKNEVKTEKIVLQIEQRQ